MAPSRVFAARPPGNSFPGALAHDDSDCAIALFGDVPHLKTNLHHSPAVWHTMIPTVPLPCLAMYPI